MSTLLVFGGTGRQGRGVVDAFVSKKNVDWNIRVLTRDGQSDASQELVKQGVEIVEGRVECEADIRKAVEGCTAVYLNLDYWSLGEEKEVEYGKRIVDVSKECGVDYFVYSSLEYIEKQSGGKYKFGAFDNKGKIEGYARASGMDCAFVKFSTYMENFISGHTKLKQLDDKWTYAFAMPLGGRGLTLVPVHDIGRVIAEVIKDKRKYNGQSIGLAGDHLTLEEMSSIFTEVTGHPAVIEDIPMDKYHEQNPMGYPMWAFKNENEDLFKNYVKESRSIVPDVMDFRAWLKTNWKRE